MWRLFLSFFDRQTEKVFHRHLFGWRAKASRQQWHYTSWECAAEILFYYSVHIPRRDGSLWAKSLWRRTEDRAQSHWSLLRWAPCDLTSDTWLVFNQWKWHCWTYGAFWWLFDALRPCPHIFLCDSMLVLARNSFRLRRVLLLLMTLKAVSWNEKKRYLTTKSNALCMYEIGVFSTQILGREALITFEWPILLHTFVEKLWIRIIYLQSISTTFKSLISKGSDWRYMWRAGFGKFCFWYL